MATETTMVPRITRAEWLQQWAEHKANIMGAELDEKDREKILNRHTALKDMFETFDPEQLMRMGIDP